MRIETTEIPIEAPADVSGFEQIERRLEAVQRQSEATNRKFSSDLKQMAAAARQEADATKAAYDVKRRAAEEAARALRDSSKDGREAARQVANAAKDEASALREVAKAAEEKARALERSGAEAVRAETQAVKEQTAALKQQEVQQTLLADARTRGLERARDMASRFSQMGKNGLNLGAELAGDYQAGAGASAKLDAMFAKIGDTDAAVSDLKDNLSSLAFDAAMPDDDPLNAAAAGLAGFGVNAEMVKGIMPGLIGQSRLYNQSLESVSEAFGRAFASGNVGSLRRIGVVISQEEVDRIKDISNEGEKQRAIYEAVKQSLDKYALSMTQGMTAGEIAANRQALAIDGVREALGAGTDAGKQWADNLASNFLKVVGSNTELAKTAGFVFEIGSAGVASVGSIAELGANIGLAAQSGRDFLGWIKGIKGAREAATIATQAATVAEGENAIATGTAAEALGAETVTAGESAIATGAAGAAAGESAIGFGLMATSIWGVVAAAGAAVVALGSLLLAKKSWDVNKDKILSPTSSTTDKRSDQQKEDDAQKLETLNDIRERSKGLSLRDRYVINRKLAAGYADLGETETGLEVSQEANQLRQQLPKNFTTANSRDAQILLRTIRGLNTRKNMAARLGNGGFKGFGHYGGGSDSTAEKLQSQGEKIQADAARALSGETPVSRAPRPTLVSRVRSAFSGNAAGDDPYADQIEQLERELHYARGKANKGRRQDIQDQLFELKAKQKDWREAHKASVAREREESRQAKAEQRDAERRRKEAERGQKAQDKADERQQDAAQSDKEMLESLKRQNAANAQIATLEDELEDARDARNAARAGQLTEEIARVKADAALADELGRAALEDDKARRSALEQAARLRHEGALDAARHEARRAERDVREMAEQGTRTDTKARGSRDGAAMSAHGGWREQGGGFLPNGLRNGDGMRPAVPLPLPSQTPWFEPMDSTGMPSQRDLGRTQGAESDSNVGRDGGYAGSRTVRGADGKPIHIGEPIRLNGGHDLLQSSMTFGSIMRAAMEASQRNSAQAQSASPEGVGSGRMPDTTFRDYHVSQQGDNLRFTSQLDVNTKDLATALGVPWTRRGRLPR